MKQVNQDAIQVHPRGKKDKKDGTTTYRDTVACGKTCYVIDDGGTLVYVCGYYLLRSAGSLYGDWCTEVGIKRHTNR